MKNSVFYPIIFFCSLLWSCGNPATQNTGDDATTDATLGYDEVTLEIKKYEEREADCHANDDCTYVVLQVPQLDGGNPDAVNPINSFVDEHFRETLKSRLPEPLGNAPLQDLCAGFIEGYELFVLEFPDTQQKWFLEIDGSKSILTEEFFTFYGTHSEYLGGAHPSQFVTLASFDLSTGSPIVIEERFNSELLWQIAESRFRETHNLTQDEDLNDAGFMFENGKFILPENMALTAEGILMVYNPYEVVAYSEGETRFVISYDELNENI